MSAFCWVSYTMGASVCKKCKRAYPKYMDKCPSCHPTKPVATLSVPKPTNNVPQQTDSVDVTYSVAPGEVCPTCGHQQAKTPKQRHAEWRARNR